jgi:hypothetical protein
VSALLPLVVLLSATAPEPPKLVLLEAVGTPADVDALRVSLEDWLKPMALELELMNPLPPPEQLPSFARVRVVWTDEVCVVEVFRGNGALARKKLLPRAGAPLLVLESAALIAQAGVRELSIEEHQREPLSAPPLTAAEEVVKQPAPPPPSTVELGLAAFVQGRSFDERSPFVFGGGAELHANLALGAWRPSASLLVAYQGPVSRSSTLVNLQVQTLSFRLLPGLKRELGVFELEAGGGGGLDVLLADTSASELPAGSFEDRTDVAPFLSAALGVRVRPSESSAIFLRAVVDFDPAKRRYRARLGGEPVTLLEPWTVRPALQLGFSFDLISGARR